MFYTILIIIIAVLAISFALSVTVLALKLLFLLLPVILIGYIVYKVVNANKAPTDTEYQRYTRPRRDTVRDDVVDVDYTVHEAKDDTKQD